MNLPSISVIIPTLNAASVLEGCLRSIASQDYPKELVEIVIADGGSTDGTVELAKKYGAKIFENPLKVASAGKAVGFRNAKNELIALIDSDNILPGPTWFRRMVEPFSDPEIIGSEPWEYTWRARDGFIDRYCALMGMNDPFCYFLGNYDRLNLLSGRWTEVEVGEEDRGGWLKITLTKKGLPTIGANGAFLRRSFLEKVGVGDHLRDIDILAKAVFETGEAKFAKVKIGIIHLFCGSDVRKFARKQRRRVRDYLYAQSQKVRFYPWQMERRWGTFKFIFYCLTVFPLLFQTLKGYFRKKDWAWFFHPLACWITLWVYGTGVLAGFFGKQSQMSRKNWSQ